MNQYSQTRRMITAFFDDRSEASRAVDSLRNAGIADSSIRMIEGDTTGASSSSTTQEDKGFFAMLGDLFMPSDDQDTYAEGLRRGGYVVSVDTAEGEEDIVVDILDVEGSVDLDSRSEEWASEGWARPTASDTSRSSGTGDMMGGTPGMTSTGVHTGQFAEGRTGDDDESLVPMTGGMGSSTYGSDTTRGTGTDSLTGGLGQTGYSDVQSGDKIQVAAEELRVGKRDVNLGRVRVRSYVVENPVSEDISLRSERVEISRTPVDRAATSTDQLFQERSVEMEERAEEAVVTKDARIIEEISIGKTAEEHVETVSDTVRHTEVEIEDDRTTGGSTRGRTATDRTGTSGSYAEDDRTLMDSIKGGLGLDDDTARGGSSSR